MEISGSAAHKDLWGAVSLAQKHIEPNSASSMKEEAKLRQVYNSLVFTRLLLATGIHRNQENVSPKKTPPVIPYGTQM